MEKNQEERKVSDLDIEKWSEGNKHLQRLLISCRENNIPSMFCCAGHGKNKPAYITLQMNDETLGKIYNVMNSMSDVKNIAFRFAQKEFGIAPNFTLYMLNSKEQNDIMNKISDAITKEEKLEDLPKNFNQLAKISNILKNNDISFDLEYKIGNKKNNLFIQNLKFGNSKYIEKSDFKEMGFKSTQDMFGKPHYYINGITKGEKEQNVLNNIIKNLSKIYDIDVEEKSEEELNFKQKIAKKLASNKVLTKLPPVYKFITNNLKFLPEGVRYKR